MFGFLIGGGAQAGRGWITSRRKREAYRRAFAGFEPAAVAAFDEERITALLADPGIVRNRLQINAAVGTARAFLAGRRGLGGFDAEGWGFGGGRPIGNGWATLAEVPAETTASRALSADLKRRGFRFVGPTIMYAYMQAVGLVNDHLVSCFRYQEVS